MLIRCYSLPKFVALKQATFRVKKSIENAKERVEDPVNDVLYSKMVSNKFITVANIFTNISLCYKAMPEFVASRWATFWNQKSIENAKERVWVL